MAPLAATVTAMVAVFESSVTVIVELPADFDAIAIFASPLLATVATPSAEEEAVAPTSPSTASVFAVATLVAEAKTTGAEYLVIVPIVIAPLAATVTVNEAS